MPIWLPFACDRRDTCLLLGQRRASSLIRILGILAAYGLFTAIQPSLINPRQA
jgi:hypothetical protein